MTFIQPPRSNNLLNKILLFLILGLIFGTYWLITLYSNSVGLTHGILDMRSQISQIQTQNAELKNKVFSLLDSANLQNLAKDRQLIQEKNPQYLEVDKQWSFASQ